MLRCTILQKYWMNLEHLILDCMRILAIEFLRKADRVPASPAAERGLRITASELCVACIRRPGVTRSHAGLETPSRVTVLCDAPTAFYCFKIRKKKGDGIAFCYLNCIHERNEL